jgi:hypothetical protein
VKTVKLGASSGASFGIGPKVRLHIAPSTRMSAGPDPVRSNAIGVPSREVTVGM